MKHNTTTILPQLLFSFLPCLGRVGKDPTPEVSPLTRKISVYLGLKQSPSFSGLPFWFPSSTRRGGGQTLRRSPNGESGLNRGSSQSTQFYFVTSTTFSRLKSRVQRGIRKHHTSSLSLLEDTKYLSSPSTDSHDRSFERSLTVTQSSVYLQVPLVSTVIPLSSLLPPTPKIL